VDVLEFLQRRADAQGAVDLRLRHGGADLRQLAGQLGKAQVAVRIDEHPPMMPAPAAGP
jgi:hypothetical protein